CSLFFGSAPAAQRSTLFPYTTLFRSSITPSHRRSASRCRRRSCFRRNHIRPESISPPNRCTTWDIRSTGTACSIMSDGRPSSNRSEEHTSELQSPYDLVCRLLLEKQK